MTEQRFAGQAAIVTGGSNGIGRAITERLAAAGASVLVCDLAESGYFTGVPAVATLTGDVADTAMADRAVSTAAARFGRLDILVNNAAAYPDGSLLDMRVGDWERVFAVNVTGAFAMMQAFARHCVARASGGAIVSVSTGSVRSPRPGGAAYSASKAALEVMSKVFAMELGPLGIRVNVVAPGYIDVRGTSDAFPDRAPEGLRAALVRAIPIGTAGRPGDVAEAVLFLASALASHITGATLEVDGGSGAGRFTLPAAAGRDGARARG